MGLCCQYLVSCRVDRSPLAVLRNQVYAIASWKAQLSAHCCGQVDGKMIQKRYCYPGKIGRGTTLIQFHYQNQLLHWEGYLKLKQARHRHVSFDLYDLL